MYDSNSKGISWTAGFFMLIAFTVAAFIVAALVSLPVWTAMTGLGIKDIEKGISDPANSRAVKVMQIINSAIGFFVPAVVTAALLNRKPMNLLGFSKYINWKQIGLVAVIMVTALFVSAALAYLNENIPISPSWKNSFDKLEKEYNQQIEAVLSLNNAGEYLMALFIMAVLPAICEETLFRGGLQNFLTRATRMPWVSILVVSLLFSAAHFSFYGFLSRLFLGIMLGLIFEYSGKLWLCIIAHFLNNALAITFIYYYKMQGKSLQEAMADSNGSYAGLLALPLLVALIIFFKKIAAKPAGQSASWAPGTKDDPPAALS
jgi:uncharacterized protein